MKKIGLVRKVFSILLMQSLLLISVSSYATIVNKAEEDQDKTYVTIKLSDDEKREIEKGWEDGTSKKQASATTFDIRDKNACLQLRSYLKALGENEMSKSVDLCKAKGDKNSISVIAIYEDNPENTKIEKLKDRLKAMQNSQQNDQRMQNGAYISDLLPEDEKERNLTIDTMQMGVLGAGVIAALASMPKEFTNWDEDVRTWDYYATQTPRWDNDSWSINYVAHPYAGATYYLIARHNGFSRFESLGYSIFMSTFWWEYGLEAFYEIPSLTDIIVTPLLGSLLGLLFELGIEYIKANDGKLFGSKMIGSVAMFIMDPVSPILAKCRSTFQYLEDHDFKMRIFLGHQLSRDYYPITHPYMNPLDEGTAREDNTRIGAGFGLMFELSY